MTTKRSPGKTWKVAEWEPPDKMRRWLAAWFAFAKNERDPDCYRNVIATGVIELKAKGRLVHLIVDNQAFYPAIAWSEKPDGSQWNTDIPWMLDPMAQVLGLSVWLVHPRDRIRAAEEQGVEGL